MSTTAPAPPSSSTLATEIAGLRDLTVRQLQDRYAALSGRESRSFNRAYLFKKVAWLLQELHEGGLAPEARSLAAELAQGAKLRTRSRAPSAPLEPEQPPAAHPLDPRLPAPGTVLRKEHNGVVHEITVLDDGFEYQRTRYGSLSRIAKEITGTSWNGFLFFGLAGRRKAGGRRLEAGGRANG